MSSDLIGRRRASEQRLDRARSLELTLNEKLEILASATGMSIEDLDFDGSFRAALTALGAVAARRTRFDAIVTLPDAPFAMRIQNVNNAVSAEVLIQRDGPFEPLTAPTYTEPVYVATTLPKPTLPAPTRAEPIYSATTLPAPAYQTAAYQASPYPAPANEPPQYPAPANQVAPPQYPAAPYPAPPHQAAPPQYPAAPYPAPPHQAPPPYQASPYPAPRYTPTFGAAALAAPAYEASSEFYPESHSSETAYPEPAQPVSAAGLSNSPEPQSISADEPAAMVRVASDLAALLWQGMDDMSS